MEGGRRQRCSKLEAKPPGAARNAASYRAAKEERRGGFCVGEGGGGRIVGR